MAALERLARELGAADPSLSTECHVVLAREQLRRRDFEGARRTLEALPGSRAAPALACRVHVLRAEALLRGGDPGAAAVELERARPMASGPALFHVEAGLAD